MMLIERAEQLKRELTDQWVIVKADVPELRRFDGLTGKVKTVNMNCRVLVQFDNPVDISWYDIDPDYLTVVDEPLPKKEPAKEEKKAAPAAKSAPKKATGGMSPLEAARAQGAGGAETKPAPPKAAGLSPLEMARQQGAGGESGSSAPAAEKKLSPLEQARQQGAGGADTAEEKVEEEAPPETVAAEQPAEEKPAASEDTSGLSPIELARKQGAFKG
jgi:hypothetical protein